MTIEERAQKQYQALLAQRAHMQREMDAVDGAIAILEQLLQIDTTKQESLLDVSEQDVVE